MKFEILSHACMTVSHGENSVVIDPWLIGSCYWRSWWNFPQSKFDPELLAQVDAVVITHIHWDHWHGPTLKKFLRGKTIIIPDTPCMRSEQDLRAIGFDKIVRVAHGQTVNLGRAEDGIKITLYQFGLFFDDAAVVIEAGGKVILNANDAKIAGSALGGLLRRHSKIDFAFRSHSSANTRVCFEIIEDSSERIDDRNHYFRAFQAFMDSVKPQYAIPFASNHCHLHEDVVHFNTYISNPVQLRNYCNEVPLRPWTLQVMLPGSSWSDTSGFVLSSEAEFDDLENSLSTYLNTVRTTLEKNREIENKVKISNGLINRFIGFFGVRFRPRNCSGEFTLTLRWPDDRRESFNCNIDTGKSEFLDVERKAEKHRPVIEMPAIIFRDAVRKNMFQHAGISKRCRFISVDIEDHHRITAIFRFLELRETGVYPVSWSHSWRVISAYILRWRELIVYIHAFWLIKFRKQPIYEVEESVLRGKL